MSTIKTWQERIVGDNRTWAVEAGMKAEIAELRAALAASGGNAAPDGAVTDYGNIPELPEPLEIHWPTLHRQALGCGVEDRAIHCRYSAAEYGWEDGVDRAIECVPEAIYDADQMREYGKACHAVGRGAAVREYIENGTFKDVAAPNAALVAAQDSISWEPLTAAGQIGKHDLVRFDLCGEKKVHKVALILNAGTGQEEIIYHRRNNWYLITSMSIKGEGSQKNVEFLPVSSALSAAGQEVVE